MLLAGDIGGTKTVLALFDAQEGATLIDRHPVLERTFPSQQYHSLELIIEEFLAKCPHHVSAGSFGVAGPVVGGTAHITNLPWHLSEESLRQVLGTVHVHLINDLEATARAVPGAEGGWLSVGAIWVTANTKTRSRNNSRLVACRSASAPLIVGAASFTGEPGARPPRWRGRGSPRGRTSP